MIVSQQIPFLAGRIDSAHVFPNFPTGICSATVRGPRHANEGRRYRTLSAVGTLHPSMWTKFSTKHIVSVFRRDCLGRLLVLFLRVFISSLVIVGSSFSVPHTVQITKWRDINLRVEVSCESSFPGGTRTPIFFPEVNVQSHVILKGTLS
jgi:hypothetical protein